MIATPARLRRDERLEAGAADEHGSERSSVDTESGSAQRSAFALEQVGPLRRRCVPEGPGLPRERPHRRAGSEAPSSSARSFQGREGRHRNARARRASAPGVRFKRLQGRTVGLGTRSLRSDRGECSAPSGWQNANGSGSGGSRDAELLHARFERGPLESENAAAPRSPLTRQPTLSRTDRMCSRSISSRVRRRFVRGPRGGRREGVVQLEPALRREDDRALDDVLQLPDVAGPVIRHELAQRPAR